MFLVSPIELIYLSLSLLCSFSHFLPSFILLPWYLYFFLSTVRRRDVVVRNSRVWLVYPHWPMFSNTIVEKGHTYYRYWPMQQCQRIQGQRTGNRECEPVRAKNPSCPCAFLRTIFSSTHSTCASYLPNKQFDRGNVHRLWSLRINFP